MRLPAISLGLAALITPACKQESNERQLIISNARTLARCCNPDGTFPQKVGEFQIQVFDAQFDFIDEDTRATFFTAELVADRGLEPGEHAGEPPVTLSIESGSQITGGSTTVEVFVQHCDFGRVTVNFLAEVSGRRSDDRSLFTSGINETFDVINTCPPDSNPEPPPQELLEALLGRNVQSFDRFAVNTPTGVETLNPLDRIDPQVPIYDYTETFQVGSAVFELTQEQLDSAFLGATPLFPEGEGDFGLTLVSSSSLPMMPGEYLIAWQCVRGDIPLQQDTTFYDYTLSLDRDDNEANNQVALDPFVNDQYLNTDFRFQAQYQPGSTGWIWWAIDSTNGGFVVTDTASRAILFGQVAFFVIPISEINSTLDAVPGRFTTFAHEGDFGQISDWSGDSSPPQTQDRLSISLTGQ